LPTRVLLLFFFTLAPLGAGAEGVVYGYGKRSCEHYLEVRQGSAQGIESETREYLAYLSWFAGFASAMSAGADKEVLSDMDTEAIAAWLERYCRDHPADTLFDATVKAMVEIDKGGS
jgi:hypothetical protein